MSQGTTRQSTPRGLKRMVMRAPILLYRLRLGTLLGQRLLMLTHIGRTSGQLRRAVLEVLRHDHATGVYVIASGWGEKSDWLRNVEHNPHVLVDAGARRFEAVAKRLTLDAAADELCDYARRYPLAFRGLSKLMIGETLDATADTCRRLAEAVPVVTLHPRD